MIDAKRGQVGSPVDWRQPVASVAEVGGVIRFELRDCSIDGLIHAGGHTVTSTNHLVRTACGLFFMVPDKRYYKTFDWPERPVDCLACIAVI